MAVDELRLDTARQVKYFTRCFTSFLPSAYVAADSTRLTFASFIVSALDLLAVPLSAKDRAAIRRWVLSLQHPDGGFCGSATHTHSGREARRGEPNIAATFFALVLLGIAAEEGDAQFAFKGVDRRGCLRFLRRLQREDGSFGQNLWEGAPTGGRDMRHSYLAGCLRWMLRGDVEEGDAAWEEDINVDKMIAHIRQGQTYDGGLAEATEHESHAGYAYCGVAALSMLDRASPSPSAINNGIPDQRRLIDYLVNRQFAFITRGDSDEEDSDDDEDGNQSLEATKLGELNLDDGCLRVGFNGRPNKTADSCYTWWVGGALKLLDKSDLVALSPSRRLLLEGMQHRIGGFSKVAGGPPDVHHSYLGLAALAALGDPDLKTFDVALCCSQETTRKIELARKGLVEDAQVTSEGAYADDGFWASTGDGMDAK